MVFKAIESSDFKSRPDDFKNVSDCFFQLKKVLKNFHISYRLC